MKFQARGNMRSSPGFTLGNNVAPFSLSAQLKGGLAAEVGAVKLAIGEVPIKLRIPFLKRCHPVLVIGTIGPVSVKLDPFTCSVKDVAITGDVWVGGKQGLVVMTEGKVSCSTDMAVDGVVTGNVSLGQVHLGADAETCVTHQNKAAE
jgi:hypothetical protein